MSEQYHKLAPVDSRGVVDIVDSGGRVACIFPSAGRRRDATFKLADTCLAALNAAEENGQRESLLERAAMLLNQSQPVEERRERSKKWLAEYQQLTKD